MPQRSANLHPAIDARTLACAREHGTNFTRLCNAALYLFLQSSDDAQADVLSIVTRMQHKSRAARLRATAVSAVASTSREREASGGLVSHEEIAA